LKKAALTSNKIISGGTRLVTEKIDLSNRGRRGAGEETNSGLVRKRSLDSVRHWDWSRETTMWVAIGGEKG